MGGIQLGAMLARRETIIDGHGGMDTSYWWSDDLDLILRMRDAGTRVEMIDDVTVWYRQRPGQLTQDRAGTHTDMVRALHESIRRKRQQ
jgi:GT2 family glycosyltransferase